MQKIKIEGCFGANFHSLFRFFTTTCTSSYYLSLYTKITTMFKNKTQQLATKFTRQAHSSAKLLGTRQTHSGEIGKDESKQKFSNSTNLPKYSQSHDARKKQKINSQLKNKQHKPILQLNLLKYHQKILYHLF